MDLYHAREHLHDLARLLEFRLLDHREEWLAARLEDLDYGDTDGICKAARAYPLTGVKKVPGVWRRGAPAKLGPAAGAGGHGPALLATGVLPVRQAGAVTGSRVAGGGSAVQLVRQFLV